MNLNPHPDFLAARRYAHPLNPGERLMFETAEGLLEDTNGWPVEVDLIAHWDGDMPIEAFAVSIHVTGAIGEGGPLLLAYDTAVVEPLDQPGEGGDALALALPAGASGSITARFRPRPGAAGATSFSVLSAQARIGGQVQSLPTPAPASARSTTSTRC